MIGFFQLCKFTSIGCDDMFNDCADTSANGINQIEQCVAYTMLALNQLISLDSVGINALL